MRLDGRRRPGGAARARGPRAIGRWLGLGGALLATAVLLASCGGDDDGDDGSGDDGAEVAVEEVAFEIPDGYEGPEAGLPTEYPEPESCDGTRLGWQNPLAANVELQAQQQAFELEVGRLGGEVIALDDAVDPDTQVSNMQQLIAQDVDGIAFLPLDPRATEPVLAQAAQAEIPVLTIEKTNTLDEDPGQVTTQIWRGRDIQAFNQVSYMAEIDPGADVAVLGYAVPVPGISYLEEQTQMWAEEMGVNVAAFEENQTDDSAGGEQVGNAVITRNPELQGIIAYNDPTAIGAANAARGAGATELTVVGLNGGEDGFEAVRNGRLAATFQQDSVGTGIQAARALCGLATDPEAEVPELIVRPPTGPITEENIDSARTWDEQLEELEAG